MTSDRSGFWVSTQTSLNYDAQKEFVLHVITVDMSGLQCVLDAVNGELDVI